MADLAEHIGAVLWIVSGLFFICGVLIAMAWNDQRKTVAQLKTEAGKFPRWLIDQGQKGGVVNRDDFFCFCGEVRDKCPITSVLNWRNDILEKGGLISMTDYLNMTKELSKIAQLESSVAEKSDHQRDMLMKELQVIQLQIEKDVVSEMRKLREEIRHNGK
jgi:hypothetical protein